MAIYFRYISTGGESTTELEVYDDLSFYILWLLYDTYIYNITIDAQTREYIIADNCYQYHPVWPPTWVLFQDV